MLSNVFFASQSGYFSPDVAHNPMLHTWSLAVEEQFYLVFPFLMLALVPRGRRATVAVLVVLGLVSWWWATRTMAHAPALAFYGLHTRAWEMIVGAVAGLVLVGPCGRWPVRVRDALAWCGLFGIVASWWVMDASSAHPGVVTLLPVLSTALVVCATHGTWAARVLSWGPAVWVGLVSYSLYLWHQPVIVFALLHGQGVMTVPLALGIVVVSVALAAATTRWVEAPFRSGRWRAALTFPRFASVSVVLLLAAFLVVGTHGAKARVDEDVVARSDPHHEVYSLLGACHLEKVNAESASFCQFGESQARRVVVWGDSHARSLSAGFAHLPGPLSVQQLSISGCPPMERFERVTRPGFCQKGVAAARAALGAGDQGDVVVVMNRWTQSANATYANNNEGGIERQDPYSYGPVGGGVMAFEDVRAGLFEDYKAAVEEVLASGKTVVLVYAVPDMGWWVPQEIQRRGWWDGSQAAPVSVARAFYEARTDYAHAALDMIPDHPNLVRVYPSDVLCDEERCDGERGGRALYVDDDHLNDVGAAVLAKAVLDALHADGKGQGLPVVPDDVELWVARDGAAQAAVARIRSTLMRIAP